MSKAKPHQHFVHPRSERFEVVVEDAALRAMEDACRRVGSMETGGILIGRHERDGRQASVCEATSQPTDSSAGWAWFKRGSKGLKPLLARRWNEGLHYLGEWHFHPNAGCTPSGQDLLAMAAIASQAQYACAEPMLIVLGGRVPDQYQLSATIFPRGEPPIFLKGRSRSRFG